MVKIARYTSFVISTIISLIVLIPICLVRPFNTKNSQYFFKTLSFLMYYLAGVSVHGEGRSIIEKNSPGVLVGNHQHNFDLLSVAKIYTGKSAVLGKFQIGFIPLFGQIYSLCGNILVNRGNKRKSMESMKIVEHKILSKKLTVLIFPEGTRNPNQKLLPFKKGAFYTAIKTQTPLIPFAVSQFTHFSQINKFKHIHIYAKVLDPIPTIGLTTQDIPRLMQQARDIIQQGITELNQHYHSSLVNKV